VDDFLNHFSVVYKQAGDTGSFPAWAEGALQAIGRLIFRTEEADLISPLDKAAAKIQKVQRGKMARREQAAGSEKAVSSPVKDNKSPKRASIDASESVSAGTSKMCALFKAMDTSGDGILQKDEFVNGILYLPGIEHVQVDGTPIDRERILEIAGLIDTSQNGSINYLEFLTAFSVEEQYSESSCADSIVEDIITVIFRHRHAILMNCRYMDPEQGGKVSMEDFRQVVRGVNKALAKPERALTNLQINMLVEHLAQEGEDLSEANFAYETFLKSFFICDSTRDGEVVRRLSSSGV
jgi:Ca2+-binding EF-hand superfamily protein